MIPKINADVYPPEKIGSKNRMANVNVKTSKKNIIENKTSIKIIDEKNKIKIREKISYLNSSPTTVNTDQLTCTEAGCIRCKVNCNTV